MWVMKLKVESKKQFLGSLCVKHKVSLAAYPYSYYKDEKWLYLVGSGFMFGPEKNKKAFIAEIKKRKDRIPKLEFKNDFGMMVTKEPLFTEPFWNPKLVWLSPSIINWKEKKHTWHIASFDREVLNQIYKLAKKVLEAEMLKLKNEKISNISILRLFPELTKRQKRAFEIAINNGYYNYPRKVHLKDLAKIMKVAFSTYQEHLRRAESKIVPNIYKEL
ncbi:MAG: helix-turn-helix domain-containing protein [Candidatus Woesearchaeota archaeon]